MATVTKINLAGETVGQVTIPDALAAYKCAPMVVHACVVAHEAAKRQGTASTLTKGGVDRSGKKPYAQKGTGRARAGYMSSPLRRGGGVVFGPKPHKYNIKVNRMMRRQAFYSVLAERIKTGNVRIVADWKMDKPKTKTIVALKKVLGMRSMLCLSGAPDRIGYLAARNVAGTTFSELGAVGVSDMLTHTGLVIADDAWKTLEQRFETLPKSADRKKKEGSK